MLRLLKLRRVPGAPYVALAQYARWSRDPAEADRSDGARVGITFSSSASLVRFCNDYNAIQDHIATLPTSPLRLSTVTIDVSAGRPHAPLALQR